MNTLETTLAVMEAWEARDVQATARLLADDFQVVGPSPEALGRDAYLMFQAIHNEAFADWQFNPTEVRAEGDKVYVTFRIHATHSGTFDVSKLGLPIPPIAATGKSRDWPQEHLTATVQNGKVTKLEIKNEPGGGVIGTLEWLGRASAGDGINPMGQTASPFRLSPVTEDVIVEANKVVERFTAGGTHKGEFFGMPPTGIKGSTLGINLFRMEDGRIAEHRGNSDDLGVRMPLGAVSIGAPA